MRTCRLDLRGDDAGGAVAGRPTRPSRPRAAPRRSRRASCATRCGSPAISRQARLKSASAPSLGWSSGATPHSTKNGSCGSAIRPLTPICFQVQLDAVGAVPVAGGGLAPRRRLDRGDVVDGDDPAEPAAAERGAGAHGLAERRLVGRGVVEHLDDLEVGVAGERAASCCGCRSEGAPRRCGTPCRAVPRCAGRCWRGHRVRRRRRDGPGACRSFVGNGSQCGPDSGVGLISMSRLWASSVRAVSAGRPDGSPAPTASAGAPRSAAPARRTPARPSARPARARW